MLQKSYEQINSSQPESLFVVMGDGVSDLVLAVVAVFLSECWGGNCRLSRVGRFGMSSLTGSQLVFCVKWSQAC